MHPGVSTILWAVTVEVLHRLTHTDNCLVPECQECPTSVVELVPTETDCTALRVACVLVAFALVGYGASRCCSRRRSLGGVGPAYKIGPRPPLVTGHCATASRPRVGI